VIPEALAMLLFPQLVFLVLWQSAASTQAAPALQSLTASDTFTKAEIPKAAQAQIADLLEKNSVDWDHGRVSQLRARRVSLTPGKKDGLAVRSTASIDCGATGNCFFAILQQTGNGWRVVLRETSIEGFNIAKDMHHGLHDIKISANISADTSMQWVMVFDGTEYHALHCFQVSEQGGSQHSSQIPCPEEGTE
jgi:hypothetical protein